MKPYVWVEGDRDYIRANAATMTDSELAAYFGRTQGRHVTVNTVQKIRQRLGIKKMPGRGRAVIDYGGQGVLDALRLRADREEQKNK